MSYFNSANVLAYPAVRRGNTVSNYNAAVQNSENLLASIIRHARPDNNGSYVISLTPSTSGSTTVYAIECVIHGYYFQISNIASSSFSSNNSYYFSIKIDPNNNAPQLKAYDGSTGSIDNGSNEFIGLNFSNSLPTSETNLYSLKVVEVDSSGTVSIPNESIGSFIVELIDGGVI